MVKIFSKEDSVADIYEVLEDDGIVVLTDSVLGEKTTELEEYVDSEEDFNDELFSAAFMNNDEELTYLYLGTKLKGSVAKKLIEMTFKEESEEDIEES